MPLTRPFLLAAALAWSGTALAAQQIPREVAPGEAPEPRAERDPTPWIIGLAALAAIAIANERREDREDEERAEAESRRLPGQCLVEWPSGRDQRVVFDPDCLDAEFARARDLPLDCAVTFRSRGRFASGFDPACLAEAGWTLPG